MKFASLQYNHHLCMNLGDTIQALAAEQFLPTIDARFNRDTLKQVNATEKHLLIMNGWFTTAPQNWPPSESILPHFFGFHMADLQKVRDALLKPDSLEYFRKHQPIGCRDRHTAALLSDAGVETFYSRCLSLTFPSRKQQPQDGRIFLVDLDPMKIPIPADIEEAAVRITHLTSSLFNNDTKIQMARELLRIYRDQARLVITTRLHCALPCIAMGIPVVFFGDPNEYRVSLLTDLGVPINPRLSFVGRSIYSVASIIARRLNSRPGLGRMANRVRSLCRKVLQSSHIDWNPEPVDVTSVKQEIRDTVRSSLATHL